MGKITRAMILAAGFGTRLLPLTSDKPKALVPVNGRPMIETLVLKFADLGIEQIVINIHHFAEQLERFFEENDFGVRIELIKETEILGTGGGIKNAAPYLRDSGAFLVHNVDVLCDIDIGKMYDYHLNRNSLATLAVQNRPTTRPLLIDENNYVIGRKSSDRFFRYRLPFGAERTIGFNGIHIISADIFHNLTEEGSFDIFTSYFRLIKEGYEISGYDIGETKWLDLGKYGNLTDISAV
jgi:NDP-sugar pyrophosphorylase family protein